MQDIKKNEYAAGIIQSLIVYGMAVYLFYESVIPSLLLIPLWLFYLKEWSRERAAAKESEFRSQFKDSIQSMSAALKAGYSVENAIRETRKDILPLYGEDTRIAKEYDLMVTKLNMNRPAEQVLEEFAERVGQEDVENFVNVFSAAKRSGGDSISIIRNAVRVISEKIDTEKEIASVLAAKKLEFNIMCVVPFVIILYMKLTFGDFLRVLYESMAGRIIMSACLAAYIGAWIYGKRLLRIEV